MLSLPVYRVSCLALYTWIQLSQLVERLSRTQSIVGSNSTQGNSLKMTDCSGCIYFFIYYRAAAILAGLGFTPEMQTFPTKSVALLPVYLPLQGSS